MSLIQTEAHGGDSEDDGEKEGSDVHLEGLLRGGVDEVEDWEVGRRDW